MTGSAAPGGMDPRSPSGLRAIIDRLIGEHPRPKVMTSATRLILWENIGYLIDDERRARLFAQFEETVGVNARAIAEADEAVLMTIARQGGMRPETRVERWRTIARIILEAAGGDLDGLLPTLPRAKARTLLKRFPVIGDPGADKILLFAGLAARPALESNGLRVLARLGVFAEAASYPANHHRASDSLEAAGAGDAPWMIAAFHALRAHGQTPCKRGAPLCGSCALDAVCGHVEVRAL